ncbi:MAG: hypothetical protein M3421_03320 [Bacteroidota bacterium]|jgi:hypothetical protein|nr:hypothetical protein [Bacteroidota bacterium]
MTENSFAQGVLDNRFIFNDGIYLSAEEYFTNSPSIKFNEDELPVAKYGKFNESQFKDVFYKNKEGNFVYLNLKDIWGIQ